MDDTPAETIGPHDSLGAQMLRARAALYPTQSALAAAIDADTAACSRWLRGILKPGVASVLSIERRLGIPVRAWIEPPAADPLADTEPPAAKGAA